MRRSARSALLFAVTSALAVAATGCGSHAKAPNDHVFYQNADQVAGPVQATEWAYPQLDAPAIAPLPPYDGISLFDGAVHISRPQPWVIRRAGSMPNRRYVEYASPHAYLFSVYEFADSVGSWDEVLDEYEDEATKAGAEILSKRVPMATTNAQGAAYVMKRAVPGAKGPVVNYSHEYVLRGAHRIVLAQIVHHSDMIDGVGPELRRVVETLEVY